tara:strand:- start:2077 stop:3276 length:1200 start_codon:yes stop_codon:yes gene_type:complete
MNKAAPKLRFNEFSNNWNKAPFGELVTVSKGKFVPEKEDNMPCIELEHIEKNTGRVLGSIDSKFQKSTKNKFNKDQVLFGKLRPNLRKYAQAPFDGVCSTEILPLESAQLTNSFLLNLLQTEKFFKVSTISSGSKMPRADMDFINAYPFSFPDSQTEQQKIADFLSSVDKKISLLKEKHALLAQYKKGVMQKLFKQEVRLKDENGNAFPDWQETRFDKVFERVTRKNKEDNQNVLTISAQRGLINQEKYFNKSVSAKNVTGYYLLERGEFAYNKSYSKGYPMGAIKRLNNYNKGVVSTLYICFKIHGEQHDEFWEQYFEAGNLNREINKIAQEGARNHGLLNVSVTEFFQDIKVQMPSKKEQKRIAEFLGALDAKINAVNEQVELTQIFKKGLLQQMFV